MAEWRWSAGTARGPGGSRNFKLWMPETRERNSAWPLVMLLHGCTHNAQDMAEISGINDIAEANGFLTVYPEQSRLANLMKCWNWFDPKHQTRDAGEPSILAAVVEQVRSTQNIDAERVYLAGVSAGGAMASNSCSDLPGTFRSCRDFCWRRIQGRHQRFRGVRCDGARRPGSGAARTTCL